MLNTPFEQFADSLYRESLRSFYELEALRYGIMARLGLNEADALELAAVIIASDGETNSTQTKQVNNSQQVPRSLAETLLQTKGTNHER